MKTLPPASPRMEPASVVPVAFTVNGNEVRLAVPVRLTLADALRDVLHLTGTHIGCEHGACGMCTIVVNGSACRACLIFAVQMEGADVLTIEGMGTPGQLHPIQESFGRHHGLQCGFCTPGFIMSAFDLLTNDEGPVLEDLSNKLSGVICRCTGYRNIVQSVACVAEDYGRDLPGPLNCGTKVFPEYRSSGVTTDVTATEDSTEFEDTVPPQLRIDIPIGEPTLSFQISRVVEASREKLSQVLVDIPLLVGCLPAAELSEELGENWFRGRLRLSLGPVRLVFDGLAHVVEQTEGHMLIHAGGHDRGGDEARAVVSLAALERGESTMLEADIAIFLSGRIAGFGRAFAEDVSRRLFTDFAVSVERACEGSGTPATVRSLKGGSLVFHALRAKVSLALKSGWGRFVAALRRIGGSRRP